MPPTLADIEQPATVSVPGVHLCEIGNHNGYEYTPASLAGVADVWRELRGRWDVPLTLGHTGESVLGDGEPAYGWVDNVYYADGSLYGDYVNVPVKVAQLLKTALPKRSCTFLEGAIVDGKKRDLILQNVALLGAYQPAVNGLADVTALYNRRQLAAVGGHTVTTEATMPRASKKMLARLPDAERAAYDAWKAAHPTQRQLISGPPMSDIQSAVEKALQAAYPPASVDSDDAPGPDGPSQNVLDWFISGQDMSVIVSDADVDNLFEVPFTYDAQQDTASLGTPIAVKGTYTANNSGQESGGDGADDAADAGGSDATRGAAAAAPPADGATQQNARRLAAAVADSAVEELIDKAHSTFDQLLAAVNGIASGKPGVAEFRAMLQAAEKSLDRIKVAKPAAGDGSDDAPPPTPKPVQNSRQEEPDVKISQLARIYGLPETATEDEVMRAAEASTVAAPLVQRLAKQMDDLVQTQTEQKIDTMLGEAIKQGRLKRWAKAGEDGELYTQIRTLARSNMAMAESIVRTLPPLVDTREYGARGDEGEASTNDFSPEVERALRRLGRDPASIDPRSLGERWSADLRAKQVARAERLGLPKPDMPVARAG